MKEAGGRERKRIEKRKSKSAENWHGSEVFWKVDDGS